MIKKNEFIIGIFLIAVAALLSSCSALGKTDEFGCFPPSCSMIPQVNARKTCEDWTAGLFVWHGDCKNAGSPACTQLCEQDTLRLAQGTLMAPPPEDVLRFLPSKVPIYGRDWYTKEVDLPLTGTIYAFGPSLQSGIQTIKWLQDRGAEKVYAGISIWNEDAWKTTDQLPDELKTAYVKGFNGEPLFIQEVVFLNILDPDYQNWIKARVKEEIDFGINGFSFDEHWGTAQAMDKGAGPCDEFALEGFKQYLGEKYSAPEVFKKGISDLQTFNYCQYILDSGLLAKYQENFRQVNLGLDYQDYLFRASNKVIKDIISFASDYAREKGKPIGFGANYEPADRLDEFDFVDLLDTYIFEHEWFPGWRTQGDYARFPGGVPVSPSMKYAFSLDTNAAAMYGIYDATGLSAQGAQGGSKLILHHFAESYANRGYYMYFDLNDYLGLNFQADRALLYPYFTFLRAQPQAFLDLAQRNNLAVVLPPHASVNNRNSTDALAVSLALSEANIQHDVIGLDKIGEYPMVVTTGYAWSDTEVDQLLQYMDAGGIVVSFDNRFASLDEYFGKTSRSSLQGLKKSGTHKYGQGKFIFFNENLGEKIFQKFSLKDKTKIISAVSGLALQNFAPENVQVLPYVSGEKLVIHILNYDFQNQDFTHLENQPIKIRIPEGFITQGKTLKLISPDFEGETIVDYTIENGMIVVNIPSLYIWDIAIWNK
jgi:hypothetical protein